MVLSKEASGEQALSTSEVGKIIKSLASVSKFMKMAISMKVVGIMVKEMVKVLYGYSKVRRT